MATATQNKLIPLEDRIIVEKHEPEEKTAGGILLPDSAKEKPQQAIVVSVGPGKRDDKGNLIPIDSLKAGDRIIYPKYSGTEVKVEGKEYLILKAGDVLAKVE
ncbi:MAG: co-chaperone GroES [Candidatus Caenarcaniphilales bacterium]|nr:co-chaperone GroES [Candidatus Caenarcaniphilales bacterium]